MANKPNIRFKGFTDDWEQRKFYETFTGLQNNTLSRAELNYENGTLMNVHYGDILVKFGEYIDVSEEKLPYITNETIIDKYNTSFLKDGDIIIADTAEDITAGKCSEIVGSDNFSIISGLHTIPCRPKFKFAPKYLGYYMNSSAYHNQLVPLMQGIKVTSISKSAIYNTELIYPKSADEQEKIGAYFSSLDHLITLHQRKCDETKKLKKFMLQKMFPKNGEKIPEIRFDGFTNDWEQRKLGGVLKERSERANGDEELLSVTISTGVIRQAYSDKRNTASEDKSNYKIVCKGDVPYNSMRMWQGAVGYSGYDGIVSPAYTVLIPTEEANGKFFMELFKKETTLQIFKRWSQGLTSDTWNLKYPALSLIQFPIPSIEEQNKLAEYFQSLDNLITLHQRKRDQLKQIKKYMLQNMFPQKG